MAEKAKKPERVKDTVRKGGLRVTGAKEKPKTDKEAKKDGTSK